MSKQFLAIGSLLLVVLLWGSAVVVTKPALAEVSPLLFALLRFGVASIILVPLAQAQGGLALLPRPFPLAPLALMGMTGATLYFVAFNFGLVYTSAAEASLIVGFSPTLTAALAVAYLGERLSRGRALGIGISVLGVMLVVLAGGPRGASASNPLLGDLLVLSAMFSWAVYTMLSKRLHHTPHLAVTTYSTLLGALFLVPATVYDVATNPPAAISPGTWLAALHMGAGATALGYLLWNRALQHLDASQAGSFLNLIPLVGVASAALFLGEVPVPGQLLGGALVLAGVWLTMR